MLQIPADEQTEDDQDPIGRLLAVTIGAIDMDATDPPAPSPQKPEFDDDCSKLEDAVDRRSDDGYSPPFERRGRDFGPCTRPEGTPEEPEPPGLLDSAEGGAETTPKEPPVPVKEDVDYPPEMFQLGQELLHDITPSSPSIVS